MQVSHQVKYSYLLFLTAIKLSKYFDFKKKKDKLIILNSYLPDEVQSQSQ